MAQDRELILKILNEATEPIVTRVNPQVKAVLRPEQYNEFAKQQRIRLQDFDTLIAVQNHIGENGRLVVIATSFTIDGKNMIYWNKFLVKEVNGVMKVVGVMR